MTVSDGEIGGGIRVIRRPIAELSASPARSGHQLHPYFEVV
jgi:hypothetical protein